MAQQLTREERHDIIKEDFRFLDDVKVQNINGKLLMSDGSLPHNVSHVMYEKEFVEKWMMQFALGNDHGTNYFKANEWFTFSANGTRAVMVVDDDHAPLLLIPPLIQHNLTAREFQLLQVASRYMHMNSADTMKATDPNANLSIARTIADRLKNHKRVTLTEMVTPEFYEKNGVIPVVEQQVYYIKDILLNKQGSIEDINKLRYALYANYRKEPVTQEQYELVERLTKNSKLQIQFNPESLADIKDSAAEKVLGEREKPSNPLEC